ncbi:ATP-binding protein [Pedobacter suwonensis]|uniref:ATP-binding protein n=1 Tax=Pedobacter suwonensis TaxID=332999 RepID=UPI0036B1BE45
MNTVDEQISAIKKQLSQELSKAASDNNKIIELTNAITSLDENQIRFSVDAGLITRLGKELVGRQETAVSELVKNSYDADSREVQLIFENSWQKGGTLTISDDGLGMNRDQLINGFMRLSSSQKIHNPISERYKRIRAGKKGIGRFAAQRLGKKLTIITQVLSSDLAIKLTIDWDEFETDRDLSSITNSIEMVPKSKPEGTDLIIEGLREGWSDATIKRIFRYTSELLQPFPLSKTRKDEDSKKDDPGFKSTYFRREGGMLIPIIDEEEAIYKHAIAEIEGYILGDGQGCWSLKSDKLDFPEEVFLIGKDRNIEDSKFLHLRNVHFKCYYFIWDPSLLPPQSLTFIRDIANDKGGIRIYRNGFRVLPYGERGNDWTRLDESVRKRQILTPHANNSFFGFVELTDLVDNVYEETSSREGIIESTAFDELVDFTYRSIVSATIKVAELRGRKGKAAQKDFSRVEKSPSEKVDEAINKIKDFVENSADPDSSHTHNDSSGGREKFKEAFEEFSQAREEEKEQFEKEKSKYIDEINMLRVLAGLGLVIGEFVHEVQRFLPGFDAEINFLKSLLKDNPEALTRIDLLDTNIKAFTAYTSYFDKAISRNVVRELENIELRDVVKDFQRVIENDLTRAKIVFEKPEFVDYDLFTVPMHPSEWASILFNLYTNSKKAIIRSKNPGRMKIRCGKNEKNVYLEFSDNGDGIPKNNEEVIFNAFYTTTSAANHSSTDSDSLVGTGLGLKILKDIVEAYGGEIFVVDASEGFSTTMRIEIPKK